MPPRTQNSRQLGGKSSLVRSRCLSGEHRAAKRSGRRSELINEMFSWLSCHQALNARGVSVSTSRTQDARFEVTATTQTQPLASRGSPKIRAWSIGTKKNTCFYDISCSLRGTSAIPHTPADYIGSSRSLATPNFDFVPVSFSLPLPPSLRSRRSYRFLIR